MRDKPGSAVAATGPFHRSGPVTADPRTDRTKTGAEQRGRAADGTREGPLTPPLWAQAFDTLLTAELDHLQRRLPPGQTQLRSHTRPHGAAQDTSVWRDQLLAEVEQLAGQLKGR